jgi:RNA polymerase sigma-70 factor, ECF subfamily
MPDSPRPTPASVVASVPAVDRALAPARGSAGSIAERERRDLLAARAGDRASMQALYQAEAARLQRRLQHLTGDPVVAQDLTHDVFVIAFGGRSGFLGDARASTWLYGIARNLWRNHRRKARRRDRLLAAHSPGPVLAESLDHAAASEAVAHAELARRLAAALAGLSEPLREAFVLRAIEQLPLTEAAALAGVAESTLSKRASKAEARVRAVIEAGEDQPAPNPAQTEEPHR